MADEATTKKGDITGVGSNSAEELKRLNERLDNLEEEKAGIADDLMDVWREVKSSGFDVKALRALRQTLKKDKAARDEEWTLIELYAQTLGFGDLI